MFQYKPRVKYKPWDHRYYNIVGDFWCNTNGRLPINSHFIHIITSLHYLIQGWIKVKGDGSVALHVEFGYNLYEDYRRMKTCSKLKFKFAELSIN